LAPATLGGRELPIFRYFLPRAACAAAVAVLGVAPLLRPTAAVGAPSPIEAKKAEAKRVADQLEAQASRVVTLSRALERARRWRDQTDASVVEAQAELHATEAQVKVSKTRLERHAVDAYMRGGAAVVFSHFWRTSSDTPARQEYLKLAAGADRTTIDQLKSAREDLQARRAHLASVRADAQGAMAKVRADQSALQAAIASQRALLARLKGELAKLIADEQARRRDEMIRRARAAHTGGIGGTFACIRQLESGNNYRAPGGGAYQFQDATWQGLGQEGSAQDAPPETQDAMAVELQRRSGWRPWTTAAACGAV
jgi:transglycosylase-like protein